MPIPIDSNLILKNKGLFQTPEMEVHTLFILQETGVCIYSSHFTKKLKELDTDLITGLFSALISFSKDITSRGLEIIEMIDLKIAFKVKQGLIFIMISDITVSSIFLVDCLEKISYWFLSYYNKLGPSREYCIIQDKMLDGVFKATIKGLIHPFVYRSPKTIIKYLNSLISNDEIVGAALFSINGTVFYSSLPKMLLIHSLKEFEYVAKQGFNELYDVWDKDLGEREPLKQVRERVLNIFPKEKIILLKNDQKLFYKIIAHKTFTLIIVILFDSRISLGMADVNLQKISKNIKNLSRKRDKL
jgi:hypothetical protein